MIKLADEVKDQPFTILVADDDEDDIFLTKEALRESKLCPHVESVGDGEELMDRLNHNGKYQGLADDPQPGLILLDLNMPKKDGREALKEIKSNPALRHIPVVILTTSNAQEDIIKTYDLGANSFISKPVTFEALIEKMKVLADYWFDTVQLPPEHV